MHPPIRSQADIPDDSVRDGIDCSSDEDTARQEFKDETDINKLLYRYGVEGSNNAARPITWGMDVNYDLTLQEALNAIAETKAAHSRLPSHLKARYPTWKHLLAAAEDGSFDPTEHKNDSAEIDDPQNPKPSNKPSE